MKKLAFQIEMSFDIPDDEKEAARQCDGFLTDFLNKIRLIEQHLQNIYDPFSKATTLDAEKLYQKRGAISRFAQEIKENAHELQVIALNVIKCLSQFGVDTKVEELKAAFKDSIADINHDTDTLLDCLEDLKHNQFRERVVSAIDNLKKNSLQIELLITDRLKEFLNSDILNKDWVSSLSEEQNMTIEDKKPLIIQLQEEQAAPLNLPEPAFRRQVLNPLQTQEVMNPADLRGETRLVND